MSALSECWQPYQCAARFSASDAWHPDRPPAATKLAGITATATKHIYRCLEIQSEPVNLSKALVTQEYGVSLWAHAKPWTEEASSRSGAEVGPSFQLVIGDADAIERRRNPK